MLASELRVGTKLNRAAVRPPDFFRKRCGGNFAIMGQHAIAPAAVEAVCPAVLVPVLRGIQRQFSQDRAGFRNPVPVGQRRLGSPDYARERGLHRALLLSVRPRRPAGGSLRQGEGRTTVEIRRNIHRRVCRHRLCAIVVADPLRRVVRIRCSCRAVRADQVRHSAGPSAT